MISVSENNSILLHIAALAKTCGVSLAGKDTSEAVVVEDFKTSSTCIGQVSPPQSWVILTTDSPP